jgi:Fe-S oxidoreductase
MIRPITDVAVELIKQYGGLLWGEHGKGLRSEYVPQFFGDLYPAIQQVKAAFDPHNQLNPGKIATPATQPEATLLKIDQVPLRGEFDRQISTEVWQSYGASMHCNGNGACFNYDLNDAMCPSWKATRQRIHSPKGRASLMREWVRLDQQGDIDKGFADQVYESMAGCLACKSCAGQCPVKVNVPELRSRFLSEYHERYARPMRDYVIATLEFTMPYIAKAAFLYNGLIKQTLVDKAITKLLGMVDTPTISDQKKLMDTIKRWDVQPASTTALSQLSEPQRQRSVIVVQDVFTRYFDSDIVADTIELVAQLGYQVWLAPLKPNGKPLHVQGFSKWFDKTAQKSSKALSELSEFDIPLVGLDPAMTLVYRQEYTAVVGEDLPEVLLPQEWLLEVLPEGVNTALKQDYRLLSHCTERTNAQASQQFWSKLFERRGLSFSMPSVGCCGMSGTYGHEARNLQTSETIFKQSWQSQFDQVAENMELLATGYSCRSQVKRFKQQQIKHPIQILLASVKAEAHNASAV